MRLKSFYLPNWIHALKVVVQIWIVISTLRKGKDATTKTMKVSASLFLLMSQSHCFTLPYDKSANSIPRFF